MDDELIVKPTLEEAVSYIDEQPIRGMRGIWSIWRAPDRDGYLVRATMAVTPDRMFKYLAAGWQCVKYRQNRGGVGVWYDELNYINDMHRMLVQTLKQ
jgi:hypothetical protein